MRGESDKLETFPLRAEPFHVDFTGHLLLPVLGNHLLNAAGAHASRRGFGMACLNEEHFTWVLSRLAIEMEDLPRQYEDFTITTWVENVYRFFTDRNFEVSDQGGRPMAYARSVWAMISTQTRQPCDLEALHGGGIGDYVLQRPCPLAKPCRVRVQSDSPVHTAAVTYSDLDVNGHVNSMKYMEHILDLLPASMYRDHRLRRFEIAYVQEARMGDTLSYFMDGGSEGSGNDFQVEARSTSGEALCRARLTFE